MANSPQGETRASEPTSKETRDSASVGGSESPAPICMHPQTLDDLSFPVWECPKCGMVFADKLIFLQAGFDREAFRHALRQRSRGRHSQSGMP